jgi:alkanesulfonate monooxygenase SsuD/methylene tetrahydromethanopterin reductase-like flavin-dependent oxidoreductase (luciferase family)
VLWLCNPAYVRDVVVPEVRRGRERAGRTLDGFDIVAAVPAALAGDVTAARDTLRNELVPYFGLPFYRAMLERSGFGEEIAAFDAAAGDFDAMRAAISDRFLEVLAAIGDESAVRAGVERYMEAGATSPCVGPVPRTDFDATLRAAAPLSAG